jgi:lysophospholipase L1-like esterase
VSDNQTFPFFLSERFNSQKTGSPLVEIINAGHSAYSIREEYEYFLDRGISFSPDMVIICWSPNDISELGRQESLRMLLKGHYRFEPFKSYLRNLALYNALRVYVSYALIKLQLGSYVPDDNVDLADSNDTEREAQLWNKYSAYLAEFKRYCDKRNIKLVLVALVESGQLEGRGAFRPQERLGDLARANHVYFLDLSSAFVKLSKSTGHKQLFLLPQDIHFSPEGNRLVADCIFDFIRNDVRMSK